MSDLPEEQLAEWRGYLRNIESDPQWIAARQERMRVREAARQEILALMRAFLGDEVPLEQLRATFDTKGRKQWSSYGLGGMSFAMFLNKLVKYIPEQEELASKLKAAVQAPSSAETAKLAMENFSAHLNNLIESGVVSRQQVQPARLPMFLSAWWYFQAPEKWPIYYLSARQALRARELIRETDDIAEGYLQFTEIYGQLASDLALDFEDLETLCKWVRDREVWIDTPELRRPAPRAPQEPLKPSEGDGDEESPEPATIHTQTQWLLAKLGQHFKCKVWIATNDRSKLWEGQRLGDVSLDQLPNLGMGAEAQGIVSLIDVLWLKPDGQVVAAFEVESTTSIYSGLLRMSDLTFVVQNLVFPLYLVVPESRVEKVRRELRRPTFQGIELHQRCRYLACESLINEFSNIIRWGTHPSAIDRLATQIGDSSA